MTSSTRARSCQAAHCSHGNGPQHRAFGPAALLVAGMTAFGVVLAVFSGPTQPAHAAATAVQPPPPDVSGALGSLLSPGIAPGSVGRSSAPESRARSAESRARSAESRSRAAGDQQLTPTGTALAPLAGGPPPPAATPSAVTRPATVPATGPQAATTAPHGAPQQHSAAQLNSATRPAAAPAPAGTPKRATSAVAKRPATSKPRTSTKQVASARPADRKPIVKLGNDVSWPQCGSNGLRMPRTSRHFVVIGLTGGRAFRPNPCVKEQVSWAKKNDFYAGAYAMTTFPTKGQLSRYGTKGPFTTKSRSGRLRNAGYQAARFDLATMRHAKFATKHIWIDVEPHPSRPWTKDRKANKAVLDGVVRGYRDAGKTVGFYSTKALWQRIVGSARYHAPEWRTAGGTSIQKAAGMCSRGGFQGGRAVIAQWWTRTVDHNRTCGTTGRPEEMTRYFVKY